MRKLVIIMLLMPFMADAQIIRANGHYLPISSGFKGILDTVTSATVAYSVRKLSSTYTGNCYRVRRSSDNTEQDIGFLSNGNLDTAALKTFVGANNGFVTKWYDQSGNGNDMSQTTSANQPRVVLSGVLDRQNGRPCVRFLSASSTRLFTASVLFNGGVMTAIAAIGGFASANQDIFGNRATAVSSGWQFTYRITGTVYQVAHLGTTYTNSYSFGSIQANGVIPYINRASDQTLVYYANNNLGTLAGTRNYVSSTSPFYLGAAGNFTTTGFFNGPMMEFIGYTTDKSSNRTTLQTSLNSYFSIY